MLLSGAAVVLTSVPSARQSTHRRAKKALRDGGLHGQASPSLGVSPRGPQFTPVRLWPFLKAHGTVLDLGFGDEKQAVASRAKLYLQRLLGPSANYRLRGLEPPLSLQSGREQAHISRVPLLCPHFVSCLIPSSQQASDLGPFSPISQTWPRHGP